MLTKIMSVLIFVFFLAPTLTALHELGHAIEPVLKDETVNINLGQNPFLGFQVKNINFEIGLSKPWVGYTSWSGEDTFLRLLLGPLASFALGLLFVYMAYRLDISRGLLLACAGWCLFQFLFTIIPISYPDFLGYTKDQQSDGRQVVELLIKFYSVKQ